MPEERRGRGGRAAIGEPVGLVLLPGLAWAVPEAFAAAVCAYRFEQGDVLYRDALGHAPLTEPIPADLTAIQLRTPPRSARALAGEADGDRRLANWQGEVELDRIELASGRVTAVRATQGRLFMVLWTGDESWFDPDRAEPPLPRPARELAQRLRDGGLVLEPPATDGPGVRFTFVVDLSGDASRAKAASIADALRVLGPLEIVDRSPASLGVAEGERFHPTLVVRDVVVRGAAPAEAEAALKRALYAGLHAGARPVGPDGSRETERFQLARHGRLEAIGGAHSP